MATYIVGDIQGCYRTLTTLLDAIRFNADRDKLWLVGDLVNRGPDSLKTLRFIRGLGEQAEVVLGNHDLHLLAIHYAGHKLRSSDTLKGVLAAKDCDSLMEWLRAQPLFHFDPDLNFGMVHAGIYPGWSVSTTLKRASEVETLLRGNEFAGFLKRMYGNDPDIWSDHLEGEERLRFIVNALTRMRFVDTRGRLDLNAKGAPKNVDKESARPWFSFKQSAIKHNRIAFGHWSTLLTGQYGQCFALDSGCIWGGRLTALRIDKRVPRWYSCSC